MEHLSRRTTNAVNHLWIIAEPTPVGVLTAKRILGLSERLPIVVQQRGVVWNKVTEGVPLPPGAEDLPTLGRVPLDPVVLEASQFGATVFELDAARPALAAVGALLAEQLGLAPKTNP
jgi:CO dehydrogenase maturation factor